MEFNATPNASADAVTVTLENNASETAAGYEANGTITPSTLDLTGSDSVDVQTSTEDLLVTPTKESIEVAGSTGGEDAQNFDVDVVGSNNQAPGSGNLDNATVTISGDDVGISEQEVVLNSSNNADGTASFSGLYPEQAGEITVDVVAYKTDGTEVTDSASVSVTGDQFNSFSPTSATIDDTIEASLQVTDADGAPLNNRVVNLTHEDSSGFNVTDADTSSNDYQTGQNITIDGPNGEVKVDGTPVATFSSINNGEYSASNISFDATGSVSLEVVNAAGSDTRVNATDVLSVTGAEVYEVSSDTTPALAGVSEMHNLTVTEDGQIVNGSDLSSFTVTQTHDGSETQLSPSPVDTDDDGTNDALQVSVSATNASDTLELRVDDGNARTGSTTIDVVAPDITASINDQEGNALTEGLNSTVVYTVEDPRAGESGTFANGEIALTAVNTTYVVNGTSLADGDSPQTYTLDENGQTTVTVGVQPFGEDASAPFELVHNANDSAGSSTAAGDVSLPAESPSIYLFENGERADVPANVEPNTEVDYTFEVTDANDQNLPVDGVGFETNGGNLGVDTTLDEGFVDVSGDIGSGTVDLNINDTGVSATTLDSIVALETADLNLSADSTTVTQNDSIEFTLERLDRDRQTIGQLTITDADGNVVAENLEIDGTESVTFDTATYSAGDYTVEATKTASSQKTFNADTVNVTVEEPAGPEGYAITNVSLEPNTVESNTTVDHDLSYTVTNASNDGDSDEYTITLPASASFEGSAPNSLNVTDANGDEISISDSASLADANGGTDNQIVFGIQPDSDYDTSAVTVDANVTVAFPEVSNETAADVTLDVSDSTQGDTSATTTVTITPADGEGEFDPVAEYGNEQGEVATDGLITAIGDWRNDDLTTEELLAVIQQWRSDN
ncbi:beta strand repeat-containing protein [Halopenitus malekzadehii]|uniref:beta strand repeat-containing protein n=1 Tax=Halopenitus malekzadehii TaxID=1267564 RepID=UPI00115FD082|nr:hypothetical protein [Halopenitus malekzadehii]